MSGLFCFRPTTVSPGIFGRLGIFARRIDLVDRVGANVSIQIKAVLIADWIGLHETRDARLARSSACPCVFGNTQP